MVLSRPAVTCLDSRMPFRTTMSISALCIVVAAFALAAAPPASRPANPPRSRPSATQPASRPSTQPASQPSTQPASQPAASQPETKEWRERFASGKLRAKCPMVRDPKNPKRWVKHGLWQSWFENGKLEKEGRYKHDEMDGEWKIWFPGVEKPLIQMWKDGKRIQ